MTIKHTLMEQAENAFYKAYAPYSNFRVGAAVLTKDGHMYTGCNVENISFGLTSCAERNAIFNAISQRGKIEIEAIAVVCESPGGVTPCGACRQVIAEFGPEAKVYYRLKGQEVETNSAQLLPAGFNSLT
jgi:cytidine deaminase